MSSLQSFKLAVPQADAQVLRPRPLAGLRQRIAATPLVWMLGLPGAGKTSLAAQCVQQHQAEGERCLWYRLDEDDADIAGMLDALRHHPLADGLTLPAWSPEHQPDLRAFARRFFSQWRAAGAAPGTAVASPGQRLLLVFDDCHRVPDDAPFFELLDAAREVCGDALRLLLISRRPPPAPLARGLLAGWLATFDDLALSLSEAAEVAQRSSGRAWSAADIAQLQAANGWMAHVLALARAGSAARGGDGGGGGVGGGATLALQAASGTDADAGHSSANRRVGDFLCDELLLMLPAAQRQAFSLLAELPEVPRALARTRSTEVPPATAKFLDTLSATRFFVDVTAADAWRMHDLLRDGLRARNAAALAPHELAAARRTQAGWIATTAPDSAMNLLVAARDADGALALLQRHGRHWLAQGRHRQLLAWMGELFGAAAESASASAADWWLWRAEALLPLEPEAARPLFARSRADAVARGAAEPAYRAWCGEVASYVVQWGAVQGLAELVDELEVLEGMAEKPPEEWRFRSAADALTALMYGRAEDPRIRHHAAATALAVDQAPDAGSRIAAAAQLLIYRLWWAGDFPGARALYNAFDAEVERSDTLAPLPKLLWWSNAAIVDWQCGDPQRCYDKVERGLALAESSGIHVRDFFLLTQGIFCALSQQDWPRAKAYLARLALTERGHKRLDAMVHHFFRSWYCMCRGDARTALAHAETALPMADALGSLFHRVIVLSALAPARLHSGDVAGAQQAYRAQLALAKLSNNPTFAYIAFCSGAEIALVTGDEDGLKKQLDRILTVKQLGAFHSDCGWRTPMRARWLAFALQHGIQPEVAWQWIREKRIPRPEGHPGDWPMAVTIRALRGLEVELDGSDRPDSSAPESGTKPAAKLRELLAVLVARREGATQVDLCDWLWPQADGDKAAASLKAGVYRLRAWLGNDSVLVRDGVIALNPQRVACDLWQWLDRVAAAAARPGGNPADALHHAHEVLAGIHAAPVTALRERLARPRQSAA